MSPHPSSHPPMSVVCVLDVQPLILGVWGGKSQNVRIDATPHMNGLRSTVMRGQQRLEGDQGAETVGTR